MIPKSDTVTASLFGCSDSCISFFLKKSSRLSVAFSHPPTKPSWAVAWLTTASNAFLPWLFCVVAKATLIPSVGSVRVRRSSVNPSGCVWLKVQTASARLAFERRLGVPQDNRRLRIRKIVKICRKRIIARVLPGSGERCPDGMQAGTGGHRPHPRSGRCGRCCPCCAWPCCDELGFKFTHFL